MIEGSAEEVPLIDHAQPSEPSEAPIPVTSVDSALPFSTPSEPAGPNYGAISALALDSRPTLFPYFTVFISTTQTALYVAYAIQDRELTWTLPISGPEQLWFTLITEYPHCQDARWQLWRFFTYCLVHKGLMHIGLNLCSQLVFGIFLESTHGWWRVMVVYVLGVVGGAMACGFTSVYHPVVGCSGGVYAIAGTHLANLAINWHREQLMRWIILTGLLLALSIDVYLYFVHPMKEMSYSCHAGGLLVGFLAGTLFLKSRQVAAIRRLNDAGDGLESRLAVSGAWVAALVLLSSFLTFGAQWIASHFPPQNLFSFFGSEPKGCCWHKLASNETYDDFECLDDHFLVPRCDGVGSC